MMNNVERSRDSLIYLVKASYDSLQIKTKKLLENTLPYFPPPYNPHRSDNKLIFLVASVFLCFLVFLSLNTSCKFITGSYRRSKENLDYSLAIRESLGFFGDIPTKAWKEKKERVRLQPRHNDAKLGLRSKFANRAQPSIWYENNFEAQFTCSHEERIGGIGDGAKWTCDPHRIQTVAKTRQNQQQLSPSKNDNSANINPTNGCLVYSMGHHGERPTHKENPNYFDFSYELNLLDILGGPGSCEIHIFDSWLVDYKGLTPQGLILHPWGLEGKVDAYLGRRDFMTLEETVEHLNHSGMEIDIFKLDCEACEWHTFREWFDVPVVMRQILVELHGAPKFSDNFFETLEENSFVIFHREADTQYGGIWQEYSFLRLSPDFFEDR